MKQLALLWQMYFKRNGEIEWFPLLNNTTNLIKWNQLWIKQTDRTQVEVTFIDICLLVSMPSNWHWWSMVSGIAKIHLHQQQKYETLLTCLQVSQSIMGSLPSFWNISESLLCLYQSFLGSLSFGHPWDLKSSLISRRSQSWNLSKPEIPKNISIVFCLLCSNSRRPKQLQSRNRTQDCNLIRSEMNFTLGVG